MAKQTKFERTKAYQALRKDLLEDLESRGLVSEVYTDSVERYMDLWVLHQEAKQDIRTEGMRVMDGRGNMVENRMISLALQTSKEMRALYADLGFKDLAVKGGCSGAIDDEL